MRRFFKWCAGCKKVTEHDATDTAVGKLRACLKCGKLSEVPKDGKVRNVFGAKGRGF